MVLKRLDARVAIVSIANARPVVAKRPTVVGTHHPDGTFIASGPGIVGEGEIARRNMVYMCATLLYNFSAALACPYLPT
jgi:hypothetical protein